MSTPNLGADITLPPSSETTRYSPGLWREALDQLSATTGRLVDLFLPGTPTPDLVPREAQQLQSPEEGHVASNRMGPEHSAIVMNPSPPAPAPDTQEPAQEEQISIQSALQQGLAALMAGVDVTTTTYGPNGRTETTEFLRLGDHVSDHSDNPNTTLGRRVLAASAGGQEARSTRSDEGATRLIEETWRTLDARSARLFSNTPLTQRPEILMVDTDSERESAVPPRRTRRQRTNVEARPLEVHPPAPTSLPSYAQLSGSPFTRTQRPVDELHNIGSYYSQVLDSQSSTDSYNVRRRVNADGEEHVLHIPAEGWLDPDFYRDYDTWRGAAAAQRRTTQEVSRSFGATSTQVASASAEVNRPPPGERRRATSPSRIQIIGGRREIPAPLGARPAPPARQNNLAGWRRDRREGTSRLSALSVSFHAHRSINRSIEHGWRRDQPTSVWTRRDTP